MKAMLAVVLVLGAGSASAQVVALSQLTAFAPAGAAAVAADAPSARAIRTANERINISGPEAQKAYEGMRTKNPTELVGSWINVAQVEARGSISIRGYNMEISARPNPLNVTETIAVMKIGSGDRLWPLSIESNAILVSGHDMRCRVNSEATVILCRSYDAPSRSDETQRLLYQLYHRAAR